MQPCERQSACLISLFVKVVFVLVGCAAGDGTDVVVHIVFSRCANQE